MTVFPAQIRFGRVEIVPGLVERLIKTRRCGARPVSHMLPPQDQFSKRVCSQI